MHPKDSMWELLDGIHERAVLVRKVFNLRFCIQCSLFAHTTSHAPPMNLQVRQYQEYRRAGLTSLKQAGQLTSAKRQHASREAKRSAPTGRGRANPSASSSRKGGLPLSIGPEAFASLDGSSVLSDAEIELCTEHAILPSQFHHVKAALILEADRRGTLAFREAVDISILRRSKTAAVYAHLVRLLNQSPCEC